MTGTTVDVAIVGAGIAGLAVARSLTAAGLHVVVLEARDRLGGRVETVRVDGGPIDLGPTWFWPGESRVAALATELELAVFDDWTAGDAVVAAQGGLRRVPGPVTPPAFRFSGGVGALVDGMAAGLPDGIVRLDTPVRRVSVAGDQLAIELDDESLRAGAVVVAIPPAVAAAQGLLTEAELGSEALRVAAATPTWMGTTAKVVAVYDTPFWRDGGLSGTAVDQDGGPLQEIHDLSGPDGSPAALFGFAPVLPGQEPPVADAVAAQLARLFGPAAASPRHLIVRSWPHEQWTTGGPANNRYDLYGAAPLTQAHADGRLILASTETGTTAPGHIEGALQAAERAVELSTRSAGRVR